jgi:hypothetical protein
VKNIDSLKNEEIKKKVTLDLEVSDYVDRAYSFINYNSLAESYRCQLKLA